jgi:hypothetical protein
MFWLASGCVELRLPARKWTRGEIVRVPGTAHRQTAESPPESDRGRGAQIALCLNPSQLADQCGRRPRARPRFTRALGVDVRVALDALLDLISC